MSKRRVYRGSHGSFPWVVNIAILAVIWRTRYIAEQGTDRELDNVKQQGSLKLEYALYDEQRAWCVGCLERRSSHKVLQPSYDLRQQAAD